MSLRAAVVTVSDRSARGERADAAGPALVAAFEAAGWDVEAMVVPDGADSVEKALRAAHSGGARLIVTTGGTGVAPRDQTPEGTARVLTRIVPGVAEELRRIGASETPGGMLSRGLSGVIDAADGAASFVVNLPGSTKAVAAGIPVILSVARHVIDQLGGGDH